MQRSSDLYFQYTPLRLGFSNRFLVRIATSIIGIVAAVTTAIFLLSDVAVLFWSGLFLTAYFIYRGVRRYAEPARFQGGNVANFMDRQAQKLLETAFDKATLVGGSLLLNAARELVDTYDVENILQQLGIPRDEFISMLDQFLDEERPLRETNEYRLRRATELVLRALTTQDDPKQRIGVSHLFRALTEVEHERLQRLFAAFGVTGEDLAGAVGYYKDR